jgi:glucose-6-phosphate isomerase
MRVDIGGALAATATPGVPRAALDRLDDRVGRAHERIQAGRADDEHGYGALNLPDRTDADAIRSAVAPLANADHVLTCGIGGSAMGAATITDALGGAATYLDNVDPAWVRARLDALDLSTTALLAVSRSGTTAETLANFLVAREAYEDAGVDWTERTLVVTGEAGPLRRLADRHDLPSLTVPEGVPGRFAALSPVGLAAPAICGLDVEGLLAGGADAADRLAGSLYESPAYAYGATAYALARRGAAVNAMMPYAEAFERFAEWFAQLWAESLGKDGLGQTPARALGVTDQHSQLQLYRAGPRDKMVTFLRPAERPEVPVPDPDQSELAYLEGATLGDLTDAEFDGTAASLPAADRPAVTVEVDAVDARSLGGLLYTMEAACVVYAELADVYAFDQPDVEWSKDATREALAGGDVDAGDTLVVE